MADPIAYVLFPLPLGEGSGEGFSTSSKEEKTFIFCC
jgi:hypothetical protein